ncbi:MAG: hypothetical protein IJY35_12775, partial [Clostridia bacterium]|nr:hypothetical protein [Clostridia bacterium]
GKWVSAALKEDRSPQKLHGYDRIPLGPGITFIKDESGWSAESRARQLGFIEDEYLVLAPPA